MAGATPSGRNLGAGESQGSFQLPQRYISPSCLNLATLELEYSRLRVRVGCHGRATQCHCQWQPPNFADDHRDSSCGDVPQAANIYLILIQGGHREAASQLRKSRIPIIRPLSQCRAGVPASALRAFRLRLPRTGRSGQVRSGMLLQLQRLVAAWAAGPSWRSESP